MRNMITISAEGLRPELEELMYCILEKLRERSRVTDMTKLTDLNPRFVGAGGEGVSYADGSPVPERHGVAIGFDCPCGICKERVILFFKNPMDGKGHYESGGDTWNRVGEDFETISLTPSIQRKGKCRWHGHLTNGELVSC